jgi:cytosine/adenosine deaminase-related metal-dependent hydrolase
MVESTNTKVIAAAHHDSLAPQQYRCNMSVLENLAGRTAQWVIADTTYFDSATHSFMRGDIEIDGAKIERILPPKTSRRTEVLPGHEIVCVPGFINADTGLAQEDWPEDSHELARFGITTAGSFNRDLPDCDGFEGGGVRRLVYVELGESPPDDGLAGIDRQALERFERAANSRAFDRCTFLPAVVPREIWSAASLIALTSFAERVGRRLCVRLSGTNADARNYRETRFFSEVGLLSYLNILTGNVTIFELSQLSRRDAIVLRESSSSLVCVPEAMSEPSTGQGYTRPSFSNRAIGLSLGHEAVADLNRHAAMLMSSTTPTVGSERDTQTCNTLVDALTHSAALALGLNDIGAIAANMKADLCLFDRTSDFCSGRDSLHFIRLLVSGRPRHVLIDGLPVVVNGVFVGEVAHV